MEMTDALRSVHDDLGLGPDSWGGGVELAGAEPTDISFYRLGAASAVAHAAWGTAAAALWRQRSGQGQDVSVELPRAVQALFPHAHTRQHGRRSPFGSRDTSPGKALFPTRDGRHVLLVLGSARPHQLQRTLEVLGITSVGRIDEAVARHDAAEIEDAIYAAGAVAAVARTDDEWRAHPHGRWLAARPVIEIERIGDASPVPLDDRAGRPLGGVRVLDATHVIAGPTIAKLLAEQGADVLHVSPPTTWDPQTFTIDLGVGKRHAIADLDDPRDHASFGALAEGAHVFVQSFRPGSFDRRGFSPADLAARRPGIVAVSISCFGTADGPWSMRRGVDPIAQAVSGITRDEGGDGPPRMSRIVTLTDPLAGVLGAAGAAAALRRQQAEGGSYHVRVSLVRTAMWVQDLGRNDGAGPDDRLDTRFAHLVAPELVTMESPFGRLQYLAPVTTLSATPARWDRPPEPHGASPLAWTPA